jgi:energy-coupling factor transport system permease protein
MAVGRGRSMKGERHESDHRNPLAFIGVALVLLIPVFLSWDPYTPVLYGVLAVLHFGFNRGPFKRFLRVIRILSILPLGLVFLNLFFSQPQPGSVELEIWFFTFPSSSLRRALVVGLRSLSLMIISVHVLFLIDPVRFIQSLMQNLTVSPRVGYSFFVAWNILPRLQGDLKEIQNAHRIRLKGKRRRFRELPGAAVTLLGGAIRHAERAAASMYVRGIEEAEERTYLYEVPWRRRDSLFLLFWGLLSLSGFIFLIISHLFVFGLG